MATVEEAAAIKLYNSKKEQEMYENYAGEVQNYDAENFPLESVE
jgi:hypothetical protein